MNSKMTRIRTVLRYLVLGPIIAVGLLSIIATSDDSDDDNKPPGIGTTPTPTPTPTGSSNWDEMVWDRDNWT